MKKSDLKDGMVVELRNGNRYIIMDKSMLGLGKRGSLETYDNEMLDRFTKESDIVKVFEMSCYESMEKVLNLESNFWSQLIWERKETDWSKVPFGARVRVWDFENDVRLEGKFLGYNEGHTHPYNVFVGTNEPKIYRNCELMEEPVTYEELKKGFDNYCEGRGCTHCKYKTNTHACRYNYIIQNYNVTRK